MTPPREEKQPRSNGVACPFCHAPETEMISLFGQNLLTAQYYCNNCHTGFEAVRWKEGDEPQREEDD